jgi:hypothetical protein
VRTGPPPGRKMVMMAVDRCLLPTPGVALMSRSNPSSVGRPGITDTATSPLMMMTESRATTPWASWAGYFANPSSGPPSPDIVARPHSSLRCASVPLMPAPRRKRLPLAFRCDCDASAACQRPVSVDDTWCFKIDSG